MTDSDIQGLEEQVEHIMGWCTALEHSPCWFQDNCERLDRYQQAELQQTALMSLFTEEKEDMQITEREYTWKLVNDIRYKNITLEGAKNESLDRLSDLQVKRDMRYLPKEAKEKK